MSPAIKRYAVLIAGVGLAAAMTLTAAWPASAQPARDVTGASEQAQLQQEVDSVLRAMPGARQISQNQVAIDDFTIVTMPLPGERVARGSGEPVGTLGTPNCPSLWICVWSGTNFDGNRLQRTTCGFDDIGKIAYPGGGFWNDRARSYHNNQSRGTRSVFFDYSGSGPHWDKVLTTTAPSSSPDIGRARTDGIFVC